MSKKLAMQGSAVSAFTYDGFPYYKAGPSVLKEYTHPVVKDSQAQSVSGTGSDCTIEYTDPTEQGTIDDLRFLMTARSTGASTATFFNHYLVFDSLSLFDDGTLIDQLRNQDEIRARVSLWERHLGKDIYVAKQRNLNQTGESITGLVVTTTASQVDFSLLPLFWKSLQGRHTSDFRQLRIQYRFAVDTGSTAGTGAFCVAGSATNEYPLLTYSNIRMSSLVYRNTDPRLAPKGNYVQVIDRFHTIIKNGAFNTADTDKFTIKLKSDFPDTNSCKGLMIWGESPDNRTAYNDADNGVVVSIPETLCPELRLNSNVMWSHKLSATDLIKRRRYNYDVQMRNFSTPFEASAQASGNAQNKYLIPLCYIDFSCIEIFDQHEQTITGIPSSTNIEIDVHCGTTGIDADNTNLHIALHYIEMVTKENGIAKVNNNPTA